MATKKDPPVIPAGTMTSCPRCGYQSSLTSVEAAAELGVSKQALLNMVKRGLLPGAVREPFSGSHGFRTMIPVEAVEKLKKERAEK